MDIELPSTVKLNAKERKLYDKIDFSTGFPTSASSDRFEESAESTCQLMKLLVKRKAIPKIRVQWFTDADLNPGSYGNSRKSYFERNGATGDDILRSPHFTEYLWYFVNGPRLPAESIKQFCDILNRETLTTGMMMNRLRGFVRQQIRDHRLNKRSAADEFYKLAIETGQNRHADAIREAAMSTR